MNDESSYYTPDIREDCENTIKSTGYDVSNFKYSIAPSDVLLSDGPYIPTAFIEITFMPKRLSRNHQIANGPLIPNDFDLINGYFFET